MAGRPEPLNNFVSEGVGDQVIKDKPGILYGLTLSWRNCNVGDRIAIHDHASTATGTKIFEFVIPTAAGSFSPNFGAVGKRATAGMVLNLQVGATGADDVVVCADYD